ncbi:MAG: cysteine desulfurase [Chloroflexi bacterium]|nr:cysteine desulfurase [Chloroflexota bacterium]
MEPIYLDYNATTPVAPEVVAALRPYLETQFGNPSSGHAYGVAAHEAVDRARAPVAELLGCAVDEIVFTGGGSEANNLAIKGVVFASVELKLRRHPHLVTSAIEHPAVRNTCRYLADRFGCKVTFVPVDRHGRVDPDDVRRAITPRTVLVSIMHANNEIGTVQPIAAIAAVAREHGIPLHTDAAQSVGKIPTRVDDLGVDLLTIAGHKLYAPKGVGALYVRRGTKLDPLVHGAGHEGGRRAGTENVAYMVALGAACELVGPKLKENAERLASLRDRLHHDLIGATPGLMLNGHPLQRLPNTLNVSFPGWDGEELLARCPEVAASTGSACHAGRTEPSDVLLALGLDREVALGAVRLSLGRYTTGDEIETAARALVRASRSGVSV